MRTTFGSFGSGEEDDEDEELVVAVDMAAVEAFFPSPLSVGPPAVGFIVLIKRKIRQVMILLHMTKSIIPYQCAFDADGGPHEEAEEGEGDKRDGDDEGEGERVRRVEVRAHQDATII